jgi:hypothetical protein
VNGYAAVLAAAPLSADSRRAYLSRYGCSGLAPRVRNRSRTSAIRTRRGLGKAAVDRDELAAVDFARS